MQCKLQIKTCMSKQWACKQYRNKAENYTKTGIDLMPKYIHMQMMCNRVNRSREAVH